MLRTNLLAEAQYSQRQFKFDGVGGTSTAIVDSPFITLNQDLGTTTPRTSTRPIRRSATTAS